jgi:hypothetical protein
MEAMKIDRHDEVALDVWSLGVTIRQLEEAPVDLLQQELGQLILHREALIDLVERLKGARAA